MAENLNWWARQSAKQRLFLAGGVAAVLIAVLGGGTYLLRPDYQVLFSELVPADAAAMMAELERMKVPYRLEDAGGTILVAQDVHKVRMKLMAKELPLKGAVGFELFNNADFGMTEFAQKVNYQRAMQGEIARTIMSIEGVQTARVHLAIPEQGLFKRSAAKPKASIAIAMKPGNSLRNDQVTGIQRLVSAAIPDIAPQDVTIVGQSGVALTRGGVNELDGDALSTRLDSKRSIEEYLARKATDMLDRAFGKGEVMVSVDAALDLDQSRTTTEDVLPARTDGPNATGVIVRQRQVTREAAPASGSPEAPRSAANGQIETEYQVGHRTQQVVSTPGALKKLNVAVVLKAATGSAQLERVREVVAAAVGLDPVRGDAIAVYSMDQLASAPARANAAPAVAGDSPASAAAVPPRARAASPAWPDLTLVWAAIVIVALAILAVVLIARGRRSRSKVVETGGPMTQAEREQLLKNVEAWMRAPVEGPGVAPR